jgi:hypothetical protein
LIGPECSGKWEVVSNQYFTGVQGECVYQLVNPETKAKGKEKEKSTKKEERLEDVGNVTIKISWLNPYAGANLFEVKLVTEEGRDTPFVATYQASSRFCLLKI